ncbi:MAG: alpha/beta fold hydrolase [Gammaproteobacteria bacterium]
MDEQLAGTTRLEDPHLVSYVTGSITDTSVNGGVGGGRALANRNDYTALLGRINVPALILVGAEDTVTPIPAAEALDTGIPRSELVILDGVSHLSFLEDPETANDVIADWASQAVPSTQPQ